MLIEDGEVVLVAGETAGWKAGQPVAHCFENRSDRDAVILVVGTRLAEDVIRYPDHDMILHRGPNGRSYTRGDGTPIAPED